jgi:hypothetical protein
MKKRQKRAREVRVVPHAEEEAEIPPVERE